MFAAWEAIPTVGSLRKIGYIMGAGVACAKCMRGGGLHSIELCDAEL